MINDSWVQCLCLLLGGCFFLQGSRVCMLTGCISFVGAVCAHCSTEAMFFFMGMVLVVALYFDILWDETVRHPGQNKKVYILSIIFWVFASLGPFLMCNKTCQLMDVTRVGKWLAVHAQWLWMLLFLILGVCGCLLEHMQKMKKEDWLEVE